MHHNILVAGIAGQHNATSLLRHDPELSLG
jgi:hypothetical protein